MGKKLYVGNLGFEITDKELEDLFDQAGHVVSVNVVTDRATGRSRGFGFVEMATEEEAEKAIKSFNLKGKGGRVLNVNEVSADPQRDKSSS